jgi:signal peptidase I
MTARRVLHRAGDVALTGGAVVGLLCLLMGLAGAFLGLRPVIVLSGSMSPSIPAGSLAVAHPVSAARLHAGDVVTVADGDRQVTHRIVSVTHQGASATLRLQGDANARADDQAYQVRSAPRVVASVAGVGRVIAWLSRPPGVFVLAGYAALLLTIVTGRSGVDHGGDGERLVTRSIEGRTRRLRRRRRGSGALGGRWVSQRVARCLLRVSAAVAVLGLGAVSAAPARAAWGDAVGVSGSTVATYSVPAPVSFTCGTLGVLSVTFNWTAVAGATNYTLHYGSGGSLTKTVTGTSTTVVAAIAGGTAWLEANRDFGSTIWTSAPSASRSYTVAVVSLCS